MAVTHTTCHSRLDRESTVASDWFAGRGWIPGQAGNDRLWRGGNDRAAWGLLRVMLYLIALCFFVPGGAWAQAPATKQAPSMYADPVLEARVLAVAEELRCLVCQNETIAASQADLAVDLREQIRIKLRQGQSPQQILDFMVERYGDFVLYRPRLQTSTLALWLGPFALLALALWVLSRNIRRRRSELDERALSAEDLDRAAALLEEAAPVRKNKPRRVGTKPHRVR